MIKNSVYQIYFARCMNIFNSLLAQLVKYDVHTTRKINSIHAIFYHILSLYWGFVCPKITVLHLTLTQCLDFAFLAFLSKYRCCQCSETVTTWVPNIVHSTWLSLYPSRMTGTTSIRTIVINHHMNLISETFQIWQSIVCFLCILL